MEGKPLARDTFLIRALIRDHPKFAFVCGQSWQMAVANCSHCWNMRLPDMNTWFEVSA